jgi:hemolysin activation/secretion protein
LLGQHLTGWALGWRGKVGALNYDVFVGAPVRKPQGFRTANTTYGFNLSASF